MDDYIIRFIQSLREGGLDISISETLDVLNSLQYTEIGNQDQFRFSLLANLLKDTSKQRIFDEIYDLYFVQIAFQPQNILLILPQYGILVREIIYDINKKVQTSPYILNYLIFGQLIDRDLIVDIAARKIHEMTSDHYLRSQIITYIYLQTGLINWKNFTELFLSRLYEKHLSIDEILKIRYLIIENHSLVQKQIANIVDKFLAERGLLESIMRKKRLLGIPFTRLGNESDFESIYEEVKNLVRQLKNRKSLRNKVSRKGKKPDIRRTIRESFHNFGIPIQLKYQAKKLESKLVIICDLSTSVRYSSEFFLMFMYEVSIQSKRSNNFVFVDDLIHIDAFFENYKPLEAIRNIKYAVPPGYYNTDFGKSIRTFIAEYSHLVDSKTTIIIIGDARNNYNEPGSTVVKELQKRCYRLFWFTPETQNKWGTGDSDMLYYVDNIDQVFCTHNLFTLQNAIQVAFQS